MKNKEDNCNRPCFFAIWDNKTELYWVIPISSKVEKYKNIFNKKKLIMVGVILSFLEIF